MSEHDKLCQTPVTRGEQWLARKVRQFNQFEIDIDSSHEPHLPQFLPPEEKMLYYKIKLRAAFAVEGYIKRGVDVSDTVSVYIFYRKKVAQILDRPALTQRQKAAARYQEKKRESN